MEKMIDIIRFLAGIVEENTHSYQSDFDYDRKRLQDAEWEPSQENRTFLWMSRPCGTHCVLESEAFLRGTGAHSIWTHYEYEAAQVKAFRIIVAPERTGALVLGNVQPLNYGEQVQRVKRNALLVQTVTLSFEDGEHCVLTYEDYQRQMRSLIDTHGRIEQICYAPGNAQELSCVLQTERAISYAKKRPRRPRKPPNR